MKLLELLEILWFCSRLGVLVVSGRDVLHVVHPPLTNHNSTSKWELFSAVWFHKRPLVRRNRSWMQLSSGVQIHVFFNSYIFLPPSGAGYEWEDDFPLFPLPTSSAESASPPPRSAPKAPPPKQAVQYSRFSVSPSTVSRFSITHISDSDMDSVGGESLLTTPTEPKINSKSHTDLLQ